MPTASYTIIRDMQENDLPAVLVIEERSQLTPWSYNTLSACLSVNYYCHVLEAQNTIAGFSIASIAANECHLLDICVDPEQQSQGYGKQLLQHVIHVAQSQAALKIFLEVRASNAPAIALYDKMGFNEIGLRKAYYASQDGREDALVFALTL